MCHPMLYTVHTVHTPQLEYVYYAEYENAFNWAYVYVHLRLGRTKTVDPFAHVQLQ